MPLVVEWSTLKTVYTMISFIILIESLEEGLRIPDARMPFRVDLWEQFYLHSISVKFLCFLDDGHNRMMLIAHLPVVCVP